jgi:putative tryptophan/tyrosine transport system substrate-binding protein
VDAVLVSGEGDLYAHNKLIVELAEKNGLPTMGSYREHVEAGGLMAYGIDIAELLGRRADDVHEILKGAKPGDVPIYQSTKFEFLINLKAAKTLRLILRFHSQRKSVLLEGVSLSKSRSATGLAPAW